MTNASHIFIPSDPERFRFEADEEANPKKVWKRPWLDAPKTKGKVMNVTNQSVVTLKGFKTWTPLQAALMALETAINTGCDQIRVTSPHKYGRSALKATADKVYNVSDLLPMTSGTVMAPRVGRNTVQVVNEGESSPMARRWTLTDLNVLAPTV